MERDRVRERDGRTGRQTDLEINGERVSERPTAAN